MLLSGQATRVKIYACSCLVSPATLIENNVFSPLYILVSFVTDYNKWPQVHEFVSRLSILFH